MCNSKLTATISDNISIRLISFETDKYSAYCSVMSQIARPADHTSKFEVQMSIRKVRLYWIKGLTESLPR